ncbi:hypothetical protein [Actinomadura sp. 21ATH]|uniref:hypothetical protein n=1 Tax=Actinomadura sp. 21ATH TaxID=1735444 RepID=UPI0035C1FA8F
MPVYEEYVRDRADEAADARGQAEARLVATLDNGDPLEAIAVVAVVSARAVAGWWQRAVSLIDGEGADATEALVRTRDAARRALLDHVIPRHACPIEQEFARVRVEAARSFYRATAHLDEVTARKVS